MLVTPQEASVVVQLRKVQSHSRNELQRWAVEEIYETKWIRAVRIEREVQLLIVESRGSFSGGFGLLDRRLTVLPRNLSSVGQGTEREALGCLRVAEVARTSRSREVDKCKATERL